MPLFNIIQVTAQYSNAVLVAVLPHISEFAKNADLPISQPITTNQVAFFGCSPRTDHIGGSVVLTNGYTFTFDRGRVAAYRSPESVFSLQDPSLLKKYYGSVRINRHEALDVAHNVVKRLGYTDAMLYMDAAPEITDPIQSGTNVVPRYRFKWYSSEGKDEERRMTAVDIEIDASNRQIQMLKILTKNSYRSDPMIDVKPPIVGKPVNAPAGIGRRVKPVSSEYSKQFLEAILPQLSSFIIKSGVDRHAPITSADVDLSRYDCGLEEGQYVRTFLYLKTGERFVYRHGQVICFEAADSVRNPDNSNRLLDAFYGKDNIKAAEAISIVRNTAINLGYSLETLGFDKSPSVVPPRKQGTNLIARYFIRWVDKDDPSLFFGVGEVDATTKRLKAFYVNDHAITNIWRDSPKVNVLP